MFKSLIAVFAAALLATACATNVADPGNGSCTVTADNGKTLVVNSGYQCGDDNKRGGGTDGAAS